MIDNDSDMIGKNKRYNFIKSIFYIVILIGSLLSE